VAVVQDPNSTEDNQQNKEQTGTFNEPVSVSGTSASSGPGGYKGASGNSGAQGASSPNAPTSSGSFQNLQNYLSANQNYVNQGGLASQLSGDYNKQAQGLQNNIQNAGNSWYSANSSKDVNPDQANQYVSNALTDPTSFAKDSGNVSQFQNYLNAQNNYTAPGQFDPNQLYQNQVQNYQASTSNLGSQSGRQAALQQMYNNPYYTQGKSNLDNLILSKGVNANGVNQLQQLQQNTQGYNQNLQNAYNTNNNNINNSIAQYGQDAQAVQANTQDALGGSITGLYDQYANNLPTLTANRQSAYDIARNTLGQGNVTQDMVSKFGINPGQALYGIDPTQYLTMNTSTPTVQNTISSSDQDKMNAYNQLAGNALTGTSASDLAALQNNKQAGTFDSTPYTFNTGGFNNAVGAQQAAYQNALQQLQVDSQNVTGTYGFNPASSAANAMNPIDFRNVLTNDLAQVNAPAPEGMVKVSNGDVPGIYNGYLQRLQDLMNNYHIDPNSGLGNTLNVVNNPVVQAPANAPAQPISKPRIGLSNTRVGST
jgi:hypothetical protein